MAIERSLGMNGVPLGTPPAYGDQTGIVVEDDFEMPSDVMTSDTEDGGMLVDFDPSGGFSEESELPFEVNLADFMDEQDLNSVSSDITGKYEADKNSRVEWENTYEEGIKLLGLSIEDRTEPWDGASGVTHPILAEAVVDFQSQAIGEIFPEGGPVQTKMIGESTAHKTAQGLRVENHMNWMVTEEMDDYQDETDRLLFALPVAGSAFRKTFYNPELGRIQSIFVPAEDLVVNYEATSLKKANRVSQIMREDMNWIKKRQHSGFYRETDLQPHEQESDLKKTQRETVGEAKAGFTDDLFTLIEVHCDLDLEGFEDNDNGVLTGIALPYIVTIDLGSRKVLSIYRNWLPDDEKKKKRQHFTHYQYIPGFGFYGLGLVHLMGGIAKGATSMLRQLIDAGSLANLPAGFKTRGMRVRGDNTPLAPGEFRDVDIPSGKIADNLMALPYKEPSGVLLQLLGVITEEGRRFSSSLDLKMGNMNQETPVGTTLALIERTMKVMTAITRRLHRSLKEEYSIMVGILQDQPEKVYPYELEGVDPAIMQKDFDDRIDIIPVSDPNSSTSSHRIMKAQTSLQMYTMAPHLFNAKPLFRNALEVMEIPGAKEIIPLEEDIEPLDPISENMAGLTMKPIKAFAHQDHQSHIQVHMLGMQDPKVQSILSTSPQAAQSMQAMMAHITEHVAYQYRNEMETTLGTQLPPEGEPMPPEMEAEYSRLVAQTATKLFERNMAEKKMLENEQLLEDPNLQLETRRVAVEERKQEVSEAIAMEKIVIDKSRLLQKDGAATADREQQAKSATERVTGELLGDLLRAASETEQLDSNERIALVNQMITAVERESKLISSNRKNEEEK